MTFLINLIKILQNYLKIFVKCVSKIKRGENTFFTHSLRLPDKKPIKNVLFIIRSWNRKIGSREIPRVTGKMALEYKMKLGRG